MLITIIYHRRVQVLDRTGQTSVTEACQTVGVSRTTCYRWAARAQRYGLAALVPNSLAWLPLNVEFQGWLQSYNTRRRTHGDLIRGRTPLAVLERTSHDRAKGSPSPQPVLRKP